MKQVDIAHHELDSRYIVVVVIIITNTIIIVIIIIINIHVHCRPFRDGEGGR